MRIAGRTPILANPPNDPRSVLVTAGRRHWRARPAGPRAQAIPQFPSRRAVVRDFWSGRVDTFRADALPNSTFDPGEGKDRPKSQPVQSIHKRGASPLLRQGAGQHSIDVPVGVDPNPCQ